MLGAIIGDIVGSRFEFGEAPKKDFTLFTDDCGYTDDTICTVAIADAILHERSYQESLRDWCGRYPHPKGGYGGRFQDWLESEDPHPYGSYGNGSAMRVSPVGWLFQDYHDVMREAKASAACTHNSEEGITGAQCVATVIYWLRTCRINRDEVESAVQRNFHYSLPTIEEVMKIGHTGHFDATCSETVPMAVRCFLESENFEDAVRKAVLADGDTDTKGAITGSIAEAYFDIPDNITEKALSYLPKDMLEIIDEFIDTIGKE